MLNPWKRREVADHAPAKQRRSRAPITIGFEQLEGREMLSTGVALTIIPNETRPLSSMPRPYVGSFNPDTPLRVSYRPQTDEPISERRPARLRPLGGRFRWA
jgi:hypothetical protein